MSLQPDRARPKDQPRPTRPMEAFIPTEEVYDASVWGRFEKVAFEEPAKDVCVIKQGENVGCTSSEELKKRYLELRSMIIDPAIPYEQRLKIAEESKAVLDDLMKGSDHYDEYVAWRSRKPPPPPPIEGTDVFRTGVGSEAKKYRRF